MDKNKDPAFLFYSSDFLTGTCDLTMEERGQYITLICLQHQKGHLADKTIRLTVGNVSVDVLNKFEKDDKGLLFNRRIEAEIEKRQNFNESRRLNGKKGGRPKTNRLTDRLTDRLQVAKATKNLSENENENEDINTNKVIKHKYGSYENVLLADADYQKLITEFPADYTDRIERLSEYIASKGAKYKNHLATIRSWAKKDKPKQEEKKGSDSEYDYDKFFVN